MESIMRLAIYPPGTFYANPLKLLLSQLFGSSYAVAYAHFRRDHSYPRNILAHVGCLCLQLAGNLALLELCDVALGLDHSSIGLNLSSATVVLWVALLFATPSPIVVRVGSVAILLGALLSRRWLLGGYQLWALLQAPLDVGAYWLDAPVIGLRQPSRVGMGVLLILRVALWALLHQCVGALAGGASTAVALVVIGCSSVVTAPDNLPWLEHLGLFGWAFAMLLDSEWLYFLSITNLGGALQGISHELAGQKGTLDQLFHAAHELAHVSFFPNLVLQTIHQSCTAPYPPTVLRLGTQGDARSRRALGIVD